MIKNNDLMNILRNKSYKALPTYSTVFLHKGQWLIYCYWITYTGKSRTVDYITDLTRKDYNGYIDEYQPSLILSFDWSDCFEIFKRYTGARDGDLVF